ncbi:hypothetical protein GGS20DRAFT_526523 [Poronia punctata]|nr:hypothetical protein GGS20DRAFT_526523 [Poronia punctata]
MSISTRQSIRWLPSPTASEPTSTKVLTSPQHHFFVDIRIILKPPKQLDWAFGGISSSNGHHTTWKHTVDSRTQTPEDVVDQGDIFPLEDDSSSSSSSGNNRTLETGRMVNPATGELTDYEEIWSDVDVVHESVMVVLQSASPSGGLLVYFSGHISQAVVRVGERFAAERWEVEGAGDGGKWRCRFHVGDGDIFIPSPELLDDASSPLEVGQEIVSSHDPLQKWKVVELSRP